MWRRVSIENFRSIEKAKVDLAPFTVLVGPNGSGKSNFADALVFARDVGFDAATAVTRRGGITGVRRWSRTKPFDIGIDVRAAVARNALERAGYSHYFKIASGKEGKWYFKEETIQAPPEFTVERARTKANLSNVKQELALPETTSAMFLARQIGPLRVKNPLASVRRHRLNPEQMRQPMVITEAATLDETGSNIGAAIRRLREHDEFDGVIGPCERLFPASRTSTCERWVDTFPSFSFRTRPAGRPSSLQQRCPMGPFGLWASSWQASK